MDSRLIFRPRLQCVINPRGTQKRNVSGHVDRPFNRVEQSRREYESAGQPKLK